MRIDLNDEFYIVTDRYNYMLYRKYKSEKEKSFGKEQTECLGYFGSLKQVAKSLIDCRFSNATASLGLVVDNMATIIGLTYERVSTELVSELQRVLPDKPVGWTKDSDAELPFCDADD